MKKLFLLCLLVFTFSCSNEQYDEFPNTQNVQQELNSKKAVCSLNPSSSNCSINLINPSPINYQTETFCIGNYPEPCLEERLHPLVETEIWSQNVPNTTARVTSQSTYGSNSLNFNWIEVGINIDDIYPLLDSTRANEVYKETTCQIQEYIDSLPSLAYNQCYSIGFYHISVDFVMCNGIQDPFVDAFYYIYINELDN